MKLRILAAVIAMLPITAHAAHWNVDRTKSHLGFTVRWSGEPFVATFKSWTADIDFDQSDLTHSHVAVTVELASETSDTSENDDALKGPEGFAVSQFPSARFEASRFIYQGGDSYLALGTLMLHGVNREIQLPFKLTISANKARVEGKTTVSRLDFGLGRGEWATSNPIDHAVVIDVDLQATKAT